MPTVNNTPWKMQLSASFSAVLIVLGLVVAACDDHRQVPDPGQIRVEEVASRLASPLGLAVDEKGQIWVSEVGTGNNDGKISVIAKNGQVYTAVQGFKSGINPEGTPDGLNHLLYKDGILYILHGVDEKLYKANVASFQPGDAPLAANLLESVDIGTFVLNYNFQNDTGESNPYNLTFGPDGHLYIADAAANAVIRLTKNGGLSVFATIPGVPNPAFDATKPQTGPPTVEAVPTSIAFTGQKFLVTTLLGFPFPAGKARIYELDLSGTVTGYQEGFTSLVDLALDANQKPVVVELAQFGPQGFAPQTGRVVRSADGRITPLLSGLTMPTAIEKAGEKTYYLTGLTGQVQRITY